MGEHNPSLFPYHLKTHTKSITLPSIKNKETPENTVNTPFSRAYTFIFLSADRRFQRAVFAGTDPPVGYCLRCSHLRGTVSGRVPL